MASSLRVSRRRGALGGTLLILLGTWGGLIGFVGPYFHYAYTPDRAWAFSAGRLVLEVIPGAGAVVGGVLMLRSTLRPMAQFGALIAALSGVWFATGSALDGLWTPPGPGPGTPVAATQAGRAVEQLGFFTGLGAAVVFVAAASLGRLTIATVRDRQTSAALAVPTASGKAGRKKAGAPAGGAAAASAAPPASSRWPFRSAPPSAPPAGPAPSTPPAPARAARSSTEEPGTPLAVLRRVALGKSRPAGETGQDSPEPADATT